MGLGKTVQVLSYLRAMKEGGQRLPSLIVCPASLVLNWQEECQKFTPQLQSVAMDGDAAHRAALVDGWAPVSYTHLWATGSTSWTPTGCC